MDVQVRYAEGMAFDALRREVRDAVETALQAGFARYPQTPVRQAAEYVALGGGHRWRAIAAIAAGRIFREDALPVGLAGACGIELAHAASMLLDDLPTMDDAQYRRGKACAHLVFPGWAIDMTPTFILTMAYELSLDNQRATAERRVESAVMLSRAGQAMIAGQVADLNGDGSDESSLVARYRRKTGALFAAATFAGGVLCGADSVEAQALRRAGDNFGLAYQFLDDLADVAGSLEEVGKEPGADEGKPTAIDLFGQDGTRERASAFQEAAMSELDRFGGRADLLRALIMRASWKAD